jgi:hypothetical protein
MDKPFDSLFNGSGIICPQPDELVVHHEKILTRLDMKPEDADAYLLKQINDLYRHCLGLTRPSIGFTIINNPGFDIKNHQIILEDRIFNSGKTVTSMLKKSEHVLVFACTIGQEVENFSKDQLQKGNLLEGYLIDLIGSELAESLVAYLHHFIQQKAEKTGIGVTDRFSPGYCNWDVSAQYDLFSLLKGNNCGIKLTNSSLMTPIKSVSGIFGIGKGLQKVGYKCQRCSDKNCLLRTFQ